MGDPAGLYGLSAGLANGGPGQDQVNVCEGGTGTTAKVEITTITACP